MLSVDKYIKCIFPDLISIPPATNLEDFSLAATDFGPLYTSVFYWGENIFFALNLSVPGGFYTIMVIGAHDAMITIKNDGQCHIPSLIPGPIRNN